MGRARMRRFAANPLHLQQKDAAEAVPPGD